jgi:hypothetical protein
MNKRKSKEYFIDILIDFMRLRRKIKVRNNLKNKKNLIKNDISEMPNQRIKISRLTFLQILPKSK